MYSITAKDVKYIREKLGETQDEFAKRIGISRASVVNYEKGLQIPESKQPLLQALFNEVNTNNIKVNQSTKNEKAGIKLVPYYNVDFAESNNLVLEDREKLVPDYYMDVPEFSGCTAFRAYSDSMETQIKSGSILFATRINDWKEHLEYGQIYGIVCHDGRKYLKYIRRDKNNPNELLLLQSENERYDDFELPKNAIRSIWLIHGWLNRRT
jgi:DNA-binding XRE family transcriptional regulator